MRLLILSAGFFGCSGGPPPDGSSPAGPSAPAETAPAETAPAETAPAETAPAKTAPAETAPEETADGRVRLDAGSDVRSAIGKEVELEGTAQSAKLAAAVKVGRHLVYCLGLHGWPTSTENKTVVVRGLLEETSEYQATTSPDGLHTAGTGGPVLVLRGCVHQQP